MNKLLYSLNFSFDILYSFSLNYIYFIVTRKIWFYIEISSAYKILYFLQVIKYKATDIIIFKMLLFLHH